MLNFLYLSLFLYYLSVHILLLYLNENTYKGGIRKVVIVGKMYTDFCIYFSGCCNGGPLPIWDRDFPPELDVSSSLVQGHLLEAPTLESYQCYLFSCYVCFLVHTCSGSGSAKFYLAKFINTWSSDKHG